MNIKFKQLLKNILFFVGLTGILIYESAHYSSLIRIDYPTSLILGDISLIILIIKILLTKEKTWKYLIYALLIYLARICENNIAIDFHMTFIIIPIIASKEIELKKIIKFIFIFNSLLILMQTICYTLFNIGLMDFLIIEKENSLYRNGVLRHTMFFFHPNTFSNYLFWTYMMFVYLNFDNKKMKKIIILVAIFLAIFTYIIPNSRNAALFYIISIVLILVYNSKIRDNKYFKTMTMLSFAICMLISFILLILYNGDNILGDLTNAINKLLSGRIWLGKSYLQEYGTSLLGNYMFSPDKNYAASYVFRVVIDNWYYYMIIRIGIVFTIFFAVMFSKACYNFTQNKDYAKTYVLTIFMLYNCIEIIATLPQLSFPYFFLGMLL